MSNRVFIFSIALKNVRPQCEHWTKTRPSIGNIYVNLVQSLLPQRPQIIRPLNCWHISSGGAVRVLRFSVLIVICTARAATENVILSQRRAAARFFQIIRAADQHLRPRSALSGHSQRENKQAQLQSAVRSCRVHTSRYGGESCSFQAALPFPFETSQAPHESVIASPLIVLVYFSRGPC